MRKVGRSWRALSGGKPVRDDGRRTLIACSGGADSSALVVALAAAAGSKAGERLVVAHVVHDLRLRAEALADRDVARGVAEALGLGFVEARVRVRGKAGNAEANARRARYRALASLARENGCGFVATAHHADDQLETLIMRVMRGTGARGLRGVHPARGLGKDVTLIRPMLGLTRADAQRICADAGVVWAEDRTNLDRARLRGAVRHGVLPEIERVRPRAGVRAARVAAQLGMLADLLEVRAREVWGAGAAEGAGWVWARERLRGEPEIVVGEALRVAHGQMVGRGADRLSERVVASAVKAVRSGRGETKRFDLAGLIVDISGSAVRVSARGRG